MQLKHGNKTIIINIKNCLRMHWFSVLVSSWLKKKKPLMVIRRRKYQSLFNWWQFYEWVEDINIEKTKKVDIIKIYGRRLWPFVLVSSWCWCYAYEKQCIYDSLIDILLNIKGKTNDEVSVHQDLFEVEIQLQLHLRPWDKRTYFLPI